jgi:hypothetical protein
MVSTWDEHLRLDKLDHDTAVIEICQYEVLGEAQYDDKGECILPSDVDPENVVGIEDGLIVGGMLKCWDDTLFKYDAKTLPDAINWLKEIGWKFNTSLLVELAQAVGVSASEATALPTKPK